MQPKIRRAAALPVALLLALCSLSILAAAAQGAGEWKIAGVPLSEQEVEEAQILGSATKAFKLEIPWYATTIECKALSIPTGILKPAGKGTATLRLTECSLSGPPFVAETCKIVEPVDLKVAISLVEHSSALYALFAPQEEGKPIANITFKKGTECPLPLSNSLSGSFAGTTSSSEAVEQPIELKASTSALLSKDTLTFGTHPASLTGNASLDLWGEYKGEKWAPAIENPPPPGEKWLLLEDGESVLLLTLNIEAYGELLVPELALSIHCEPGLGTAHVKLGSEHKDLLAESKIVFEECTDLIFNEVCKVRGSGDANESEKITATISGKGTMSGEHVYIEDEEFADVIYEGSACPLTEIDGRISGSIEVLSPLTDTALKGIASGELFFGESEAELHDGEEEPVVGSVETLEGETFAMHLVNL